MDSAWLVVGVAGFGLLLAALLLHELRDRARARRFLEEIANLRGDVSAWREASEAGDADIRRAVEKLKTRG